MVCDSTISLGFFFSLGLPAAAPWKKNPSGNRLGQKNTFFSATLRSEIPNLTRENNQQDKSREMEQTQTETHLKMGRTETHFTMHGCACVWAQKHIISTHSLLRSKYTPPRQPFVILLPGLRAFYRRAVWCFISLLATQTSLIQSRWVSCPRGMFHHIEIMISWFLCFIIWMTWNPSTIISALMSSYCI